MLLFSNYCSTTTVALAFLTDGGAQYSGGLSECYMTYLEPRVQSGREGHIDHSSQGELSALKSLHIASLGSRAI